MVESVEQEAFKEAEARIAAWIPGEVLDLAIHGLVRIPASIGRLSTLSELVLSTLDETNRTWIGATQVADLTPLAGLTELQSLGCGSTQVSDLTPLAGLTALQSLNCGDTHVDDLAPLSGLTALQSLNCGFTKVANLTPLAGLTALQSLNCRNTRVDDLTPLAGLNALQSLNCGGTKVADLTPLAGPTALQSLDCGWTQVADLTPLAGLTALQSLYCSATHVDDLTPLAGLTALQNLSSGGTKVADLTPLAGLTALQSLNCGDTHVDDLTPLAGLTALQNLNCGLTQVADLAPLAGLTALQGLNCYGTLVADLTPLAGLTALQSLDCSSTQVADLTPLAGLTALQSVKLTECQIVRFPDGLFDLPKLEEVFLEGGRLADVPAEVLSQEYGDNCLPRLRAHLRDLKAGAVAIQEGKLLILGNGRVGKTQLSNRLLGRGFEENADSTHGIVISSFTLPDTDGVEPPRIQLWDFGGQDIYHSTHTLFMRSRGIYLIAWTPEMEDNDTHTHDGEEFRNRTLPFWLTQVAEFAGTSAPLIVAQTQVDKLTDKRQIDAGARARMEAFATHFEIDHSAKTDRRRDDLIEALNACYGTIDQPTIGKVRAAVKKEVVRRILENNQQTMSVPEFHALCDDLGGVADPDLFLETLHCLAPNDWAISW
ncbi:MAG: leucine-rich repeat domain-containing protein [Pseudomonadota bacterium]